MKVLRFDPSKRKLKKKKKVLHISLTQLTVELVSSKNIFSDYHSASFSVCLAVFSTTQVQPLVCIPYTHIITKAHKSAVYLEGALYKTSLGL